MLDGNLTLNINFSGKYERKEKAKLSFKEKVCLILRKI